MPDDKLTIHHVKVADLKDAEYNPRRATKKQFDDLTESIKQFGFVEPVIVNKNPERDNVIVGGHFRVKVAKAMGLEIVPAVFISVSLDKERELNLRLNKNTGDFDWDLLANYEVGLLEMVGFTPMEINTNIEPKGTVEDEPPEPRPDPNVKPGDLFQLGNHRLLCGDATKKEDIEWLMAGQKADMVFTDPPYGVSYEGKTKDALTIRNDKTTEVFAQSIPLWPLQGGASAYICCPAGNNFIEFEIPFQRLYHHSATIVWAKNSMVLGHGDYHYQHEPILYGWEKSATHNYYGDRKQTTLWNIDRPSRSSEHPTMKPIALVAKAIQNSSLNGQRVFDPFGGSGSTLIACEQLNRKCYMMEIDPQYVRVIIDRWEKLTSNKAIKI